jgi:PD-(D/E)XK nuclease superfamily protein
MTYSYTQVSHYLTCPQRYRHRYLDGWKEKDTRAAMLFGRVFERALARIIRECEEIGRQKKPPLLQTC